MDKSNASNYRAVALSSILGKMLNMIIMKVQKEELEASELQFRYKSNSSTPLLVVRFLLKVSNILLKYSPLDMYCLLMHL